MDLKSIQAALTEAKLDGWLFYDHHHRDPIAYHVLGINPVMCTRRWYYLIPAQGEPAKLVHRIENHNLDGVPGTADEYSAWPEQREKLKKLLAGRSRVAMQYSALNDIPYIGLVDAGTIELVKSLGVEIVSSADLVQLFEARWSAEQLNSHLEAGKVIHASIHKAFATIREAILAGRTITEYEIQQGFAENFAAHGIEADEAPIVAVNAHCSDPHYLPSKEGSSAIRRGDFVLLDVFGKKKTPSAVYFDVTWTGYVGDTVPAKFSDIFNIVREGRDAAISFVEKAQREGRAICGFEVDDVTRGVIKKHGYAEYFVHRTGHSIGEEVHGNGANMDNFETHDDRRIVPRTCFSVEPGIYLPEFGVRTEINLYVEEHDARVTGEIQRAVIPILAAA